VRRVLVSVLLLVVLGLVDPSPAHACSCMTSTDAGAFARADAVFRGQLVDYQPPPRRAVMSSADPVTWTFEVSEVYKGVVSERQEIVSEAWGGSCGLEIPHEGDFYVFASKATHLVVGDDQYYAGLCGGTRSVDEGLHVGVLPSAPRPTPGRPAPSGSWAPEIVGGAALLASASALAVALVRSRN
jgi:hypothetical protein